LFRPEDLRAKTAGFLTKECLKYLRLKESDVLVLSAVLVFAAQIGGVESKYNAGGDIHSCIPPKNKDISGLRSCFDVVM